MFSTPHLCVQFAEAACGGATVMLNGSVDPPFDTSRSVPPLVRLLSLWLEREFPQKSFLHFSVFGSIEAPKLKVAKLTVVLATPDNSK